MLTSSELISLVKEYDPNADAELLRKAYVFAMEAHGVQKRASGAPYFYHPAEVARILAELRLDVQTVATGLLHDVLEDTNVSFEELEEIFGSEIVFLVEGVTKLSEITYTSSQRQVENFHKFILSTLKDIRVLIVKLADRLNNMRTLNYVMSLERRKKQALETLEIYAPLAERLGMNVIKDEMEELAFYNLHPEEYCHISRQLNKLRSNDHNFVQNTILELRKIFEKGKIDVNISGREKKIYSIWKKMQRRNVTLEQINDIIAFRVIVETISECYLSLGIIHTNFLIVPGKFKDYISIPKLNNYRSLHTMIIGPLKQPIEVQIRTKEMHQIADEGMAAHWAYKNDEIIPEKNKWNVQRLFKNLLSVYQNFNNPEEIITYSKLELFQNEVFCFTPNGDLITLPRGATVIDFAYQIHTTIGNTCAGAKINGKIALIKTVLQNGDQVEIITSGIYNPEETWEKIAITSKAKLHIKKFIRTREKKEFSTLGFHLVKYLFSSMQIPFDKSLIPLKKYSSSYDCLDKFYYNVGKGVISLNSLRMDFPPSEKRTMPIDEDFVYMEDFNLGVSVHLSECCNPIMKDKIVGVFVPETGLVIHVTNCASLEEKSGQSFIKVKWTKTEDRDIEFVARLCIVILNKTESFPIITNIISSNNGKIINLKVENRSIDFFDLLVDIQVTSDENLRDILATLRTCSLVRSVRRLL
ncbi:MAG: RelA/SpoT family protein [Holosporaceae bacterium]|nr:RelA/SpoT family protein [Holosporaceae bacterium]